MTGRGQVLVGLWEQWGLSGWEPPRQTPYQALPPIVCVSSAEELPRSHYSRPRTKASASAGAPLAPYQPVAHTGYLGVGGGGCLAGDSQSAWTPHAKFLHGQDQPPLPRMGLGAWLTLVPPDPNEMSATKDGHRGACPGTRAKCWRGRRPGQLFACNNCSGHRQAMGQLAPGIGSLFLLLWNTL